MGLRKFSDTFIREEITVEMFPLLTEEHLKQLGVNTIGARLQFQTFVQNMQIETSPLSSPPKCNNCPVNNNHTNYNVETLTKEISSLRQALSTLSHSITKLSHKNLSESTKEPSLLIDVPLEQSSTELDGVE